MKKNIAKMIEDNLETFFTFLAILGFTALAILG